VHVLAGEIVSILAHVERADENGAGCFKSFDQGCVPACGRGVAVDFRTGESRKTGDIEKVFHRKRHADERRQRFILGARRIERLRAGKRALLCDRGEGI
jgi:hypothetical protein